MRQWESHYGGSECDLLHSLRKTTDGGFILGGTSWSTASGSKQSENIGNWDYWVVKLDPDGIQEWDATYGGTDQEELRCVEPTSDGGYIVGGHSSSTNSGTKTTGNSGGWDYWVVKVDSQGTRQWEANLGGTGPDMLSDVRQTGNGGYILGGTSISFPSGNKTSEGFGGWDFWVVNLDANGEERWQTSFGGSGGDSLAVLRQTADGGYILGGSSDGTDSGNKTTDPYGASDYWMLKLCGPASAARFIPGSMRRLPGIGVEFRVMGGSYGQVHQVDASTDLISWERVVTFMATGAPVTICDIKAAGLDRCFYRIQ
jgi:hypothetical protein